MARKEDLVPGTKVVLVGSDGKRVFATIIQSEQGDFDNVNWAWSTIDGDTPIGWSKTGSMPIESIELREPLREPSFPTLFKEEEGRVEAKDFAAGTVVRVRNDRGETATGIVLDTDAVHLDLGYVMVQAEGAVPTGWKAKGYVNYKYLEARAGSGQMLMEHA